MSSHSPFSLLSSLEPNFRLIALKTRFDTHAPVSTSASKQLKSNTKTYPHALASLIVENLIASRDARRNIIKTSLSSRRIFPIDGSDKGRHLRHGKAAVVRRHTQYRHGGEALTAFRYTFFPRSKTPRTISEFRPSSVRGRASGPGQTWTGL